MHNKDLTRLENLKKVNANRPSWANEDLYRLMYKEELYVVAYEKIKSKPGNMTPGSDGTTLDGFSLSEIREIIGKMRNESFQFAPARRVYIPKANGKERPLGIAPPKDKIVQEVMRMILEAIYDSPYGTTFLNVSHGFRPNRSPHTALQEIGKWSGVNWVIEGDIKGCFDNIDHQVLVKLLRKRIKDEKFLNLVWKSLRAGHLEFNIPVQSLTGSPQGSIVSPILANVYLHELDMFVAGLVEKHSQGKGRKVNPEYKRLAQKRSNLIHTNGDPVEIRKLKKEMDARPSLLQEDPGFIRIKYVRYADDWVIGVTGPKRLAEEIREEVRDFLKDHLKLDLSMEKTHIRHGKTEEAFFLGTEIKMGGSGEQKRTTSTNDSGVLFKRRSTGWTPVLKAPIPRLIKGLADKGFCTADGFPVCQDKWVNLDDDQIIEMGNSTLWGLLNFYGFAHNYAELSRVQYVIQLSLAKTLAKKHKTSAPSIFGKYGRRLRVVRKSGKTAEQVAVELRLESDWSAKPNRFFTNVSADTLDQWKTNKRLRTRSKLGKHCAICGAEDDIEMHHLRHVRKKGGKKATGFDSVMADLNRKQIPVCKECHTKIHNGDYSGLKLSDLADAELAAQ